MQTWWREQSGDKKTSGWPPWGYLRWCLEDPEPLGRTEHRGCVQRHSRSIYLPWGTQDAQKWLKGDTAEQESRTSMFKSMIMSTVWQVCAVQSEQCTVSLIYIVSLKTQTFLNEEEWLGQISAYLVGILFFSLLWSPCLFTFIQRATSLYCFPSPSTLLCSSPQSLFCHVQPYWGPKVMGTSHEGLRPQTPHGKISIFF